MPRLLKSSHPVVILILGLLIAQVVATIHVYLSNLNLHHTLTEVNSAGYLAIPNRHAMVSLRKLGPAFWGGLFFTFTIGAGCSLAGMAAGWIWVRLFQCKKSILVLTALIWGLLLAWVNHRGFSLMPTLYFLLIGPAVFYLAARRESMTDVRSNRIKRLVHYLPIPLLALLWFTQYDNNMFLDLRDNLLLSSNYGRKFSNFYYTYTLYPAEAFKALNQKTIKTCSIKDIHSRLTIQRIGKRLIANDYLPLIDAPRLDLVIMQEDKKLVFQADGRPVLQIPIDQFLDDSRNVLRQFSDECDRDAIFRQFTFLALLIGFPITIYVVVHAAFYYLGYFILGRSNSALTASIICLLIGILVLIFFQSNRSRSIQIQNISSALASADWQTRLAALKLIEQKKSLKFQITRPIRTWKKTAPPRSATGWRELWPIATGLRLWICLEFAYCGFGWTEKRSGSKFR